MTCAACRIACSSCSSISGRPTRTCGRFSVSAEKVEKRAGRIRDVEFDGDDNDTAVLPAPFPRRLEAGE